MSLRIVLLVGLAAALAMPVARSECFTDQFADGDVHWTPYFEEGVWAVRDGAFHSDGEAALSARMAEVSAAPDALIEVEFNAGDAARRNAGVVLRAHDDGSCVAIRYYDRSDGLEFIPYIGGRPGKIIAAEGKLGLDSSTWYRMKAAAVGNVVLAKCWPADAPEPAEWMLRARYRDRRPGKMGLHVHDGTHAAFRNVRICTGAELDALRESLGTAAQPDAPRPVNSLTLEVDATPFVMRAPDAPKRKVLVSVLADGEPYGISGVIEVNAAETRLRMQVEEEELAMGPLTVFLPEPEKPHDLAVKFLADDGSLEYHGVLAPARRWCFYMTPHTHYDIGFTAPQPVVIDRLAREMNDAVRFCEETADWPKESRYRWTVECTALMKQFIERNSAEKLDRLLYYARQGRIEICGFYLNMPTELVGHEELIRCLYYADTLRRQYNVPIDTVMINDVPGYTWALPELLVEAGIGRAAFRANSIRGQFLWDRPGAIERPFFWEGPEGSRVFVWYTDSYREGNFFREPGLHEDEFLKIIRRNEQAGARVDLIQLRMGGDNLPPDLDASKNARAWNERYLWPRVTVATNREYLDAIERWYAAKAPVYRGDIPSWWADGPASSAFETGMNRVNHDRLVAAEALHAVLSIADPEWTYPAQSIARAYDSMIHFDEHTWGASGSVSEPHGENTKTQWDWKARQATDTQQSVNSLLDEGMAALAARTPPVSASSILVWNPLVWPRTDVVELALERHELPANICVAMNTRTGMPSPLQRSQDGTRAWFIARDVPPLGYACYELRSSGAAAVTRFDLDERILENEVYRIEVDRETGLWTRWTDKTLERELLDIAGSVTGNQPIRDVPIGGREAVNKKQPVQFERTLAPVSEFVSCARGPVFSEIVLKTSLPGCPAILQRLRLYQGHKWVDVENTVTKEEVLDPEIIYFAFPFAVSEPVHRVQIADSWMRPGVDQLKYSCHDFYSIQHWAEVSSGGYGVLFAPLEAPVVSLGGINTYRWADEISFENGHIYSMAMNNCWDTNFRAGQAGKVRFRYRLGSFAGEPDAVTASQFAWQPFHPFLTAWLSPGARKNEPVSPTPISIAGDPALVSAVKRAETGNGLIVRLLEQRGAPATCTIRIALPGDAEVGQAFIASALEMPGEELPVTDGAVTVTLRPNEIATVLLVTP